MKLLLKKMGYIVFMLLIISIISFGAIHLAPNSFFASGELNPNITLESIERLKTVYGLDKPLFAQYFSWLKAILMLDFGISFASGKSVSDEILSRIPITLLINVISLVFIFCISVYFGIKSAIKEGGAYDYAIKQISLVSYAMPSFYLSLLLVIFFSVYLGWFPISGLNSAYTQIPRWLDSAWHLVLPITVMIFGGIGSMILYVRGLTVSILKSDYFFFAKARGIKGNRLLKYIVVPNLMPPLITILGLSLPGLIGGSVILESIFSINGMGLLFYQSALARDYPVIMGILVISSFLTLFGNMLADLWLTAINPHFKKAKRD
ncbi:MAG: ABC transporter permease [Campylobacteraceae bacterium]|jgi:peptide/nickel transport system permease protein|nr:ABC transporter permease [Campylobacteraceae bacterium]